MNCAEIVRELAVPTGAVSKVALERHLTECASCAGQARVERAFDRVWSETTPAAPGAEVWGPLWAQVVSAVDSGTPAAPALSIVAAAPASRRGRLGRWVALGGLIAVAQAAMILLTAMIVSRMTTRETPVSPLNGPEVARNVEEPNSAELPVPSEPRRNVGIAVAQVIDFELDEGQTLIFQLDDQEDRVVVRPKLIQIADDLVAAISGDLDEPVALADAEMTDILLLNALEGMDGMGPGVEARTPFPAPAVPDSSDEDGTPPAGALFPWRRPALSDLLVPTLLAYYLPAMEDSDGESPGTDRPRPPLVMAPKPNRQVTVFGIVAMPEDPAIDPRLGEIVDELHKFKPDHGFLLRAVSSRSLGEGESLDCDLADGLRARVELLDAKDSTSHKLRIRFTLQDDGMAIFTTTVATPPNQLFFCEKPLADGVRLLIGIGAR